MTELIQCTTPDRENPSWRDLTLFWQRACFENRDELLSECVRLTMEKLMREGTGAVIEVAPAQQVQAQHIPPTEAPEPAPLAPAPPTEAQEPTPKRTPAQAGAANLAAYNARKRAERAEQKASPNGDNPAPKVRAPKQTPEEIKAKARERARLWREASKNALRDMETNEASQDTSLAPETPGNGHSESNGHTPAVVDGLATAILQVNNTRFTSAEAEIQALVQAGEFPTTDQQREIATRHNMSLYGVECLLDKAWRARRSAGLKRSGKDAVEEEVEAA